MSKFLKYIFFLLPLFSLAQQTDVVDFKKAAIDIIIQPYQEKVNGKVNYQFDILKPIDSIYLDIRKGVYPISLFLNDEKANYYVKNQKLWILAPFSPSKKYKLDITYEASPKKAIYFVGWNNNGQNQVWTQGQGKYTSSWLPCIDDVNDKIEFDLSISFHKNYEVIANGKNINKESTNDTLVKWDYDMNKPMSSYLLAFAIGKYNKKIEYSQSGIPLEMYYYPKDEVKFNSTYRYSKKIFDFFETEINVPFPWQNYKQVPVKDFLYAGMENTSCTLFSDTFVVDDVAFSDRNYVNVNAHELAHQWFGDLVTAKSSTHHWLQEGFATYYALLAERLVFGDDYYFYKLYKTAEQLNAQENTKLLNPKASSLVFYQKGAWVLHTLKDLIGDDAFKKSVAMYLKQYKFKSVSTTDFMNIVKRNTKVNLSNFENTWLYSEVFPMEAAQKMLSKNKTLRQILKQPKKYCIKKSEYVQIEVLKNIANDSVMMHEQKLKTYQKAFNSTLKVRQTLSQIIEEVPQSIKKNYESLLTDKSYQTIENAFLNLWKQFPKERNSYLDEIKEIQGFNDKNVRTLWLALALVTPNYEANLSQEKLVELVGYTAPKYHFELRRNAFEYLNLIQFKNETILENLEEATQHHNWRFKKFAVNLRKRLKNQ